MFAFVIPFKPLRNSKNWEQDCFYLRRTIQSILQQSDCRFRAYVLIHDMPVMSIEHERIEYVHFPEPYAVFNEIIDGEDYLKSNTYYGPRDIEYLFDQGRKQMYGAKIAVSSGAEYVMCIDGDDLVRNNVVEYVLKKRSEYEAGWYVDKGYFHLVEEDILMRQPAAMNMLNGSTYIIHSRYIPELDVKTKSAKESDFFANHPYLQMRMKHMYGVQIKALPFYATIVQITSQNWWKNSSSIKGVNLKQKIKYLLRRVYVHNRVKKAFGFNLI